MRWHEEYLGKPWVQNPNPPHSFNCGELVRHVYKRFLGHDSPMLLADIGMIVVAIVAIVVSIYAPPAAPAVLGGWSGFNTVAAMAVMVAGSLLVNAIFPTKMPSLDANTRDLESASPTYSLNSSQNQARLLVSREISKRCREH